MSSAPLQCMIVDDEPMDRELLTEYVRRHDGLEVNAVCESAVEAVNVLGTADSADLLLLDIEMPELTGLEFARAIDPAMHVVIVTANAEYAVEAFDVEAVDYLVKPVSYARFLKAVNRVKKAAEPPSDAPASDDAPTEDAPTTLFVNTGDRYVRVSLSGVLYIEAEGNYVHVHTQDGTSHLVRSTMKQMASRLPRDDFVRVHRSYIVRVDQIKDIEDWSVVIGSTVIPVSESHRGRLMETINLI